MSELDCADCLATEGQSCDDIPAEPGSREALLGAVEAWVKSIAFRDGDQLVAYSVPKSYALLRELHDAAKAWF